jgi:hypothetical protein
MNGWESFGQPVVQRNSRKVLAPDLPKPEKESRYAICYGEEGLFRSTFATFAGAMIMTRIVVFSPAEPNHYI